MALRINAVQSLAARAWSHNFDEVLEAFAFREKPAFTNADAATAVVVVLTTIPVQAPGLHRAEAIVLRRIPPYGSTIS